MFTNPGDATAKTPAWLNDPTMYHNRGDSTFSGESSTYGDFVGLDDLFTERPEVVEGMGDIYKKWVDFGIDGFRIDTVKHVNMQFWQAFSPDVLDHAKAIGNDDFFMFGEVFDGNPAYVSEFTTKGALPAALDFGFQGAAVSWVQGKAGTGLRDLFAKDDYYTDTDSNAYELPTFLGNHDMGRVAMMLKGTAADDTELLQRVRLANSLMFLTRGQPVVYYGDEQGFIGAGGDKDARQDMFATRTAQYASEDVLVGTPGSKARYNTNSQLYRQVSALSALRQKYPALADGAQVHRYASNDAGVYAFSRIDKATGTEYVVVANNAAQTSTATFPTYSESTRFAPLYGTSSGRSTSPEGRLTVKVPAYGVQVFRATKRLPSRAAAPATYLTSPQSGGTVAGRAEIRAALPDNAFAQVSFVYREVGTTDWQPIGTDDNAPYRVFHDVSAIAKGTLLEYRAITRDASGNVSAQSTSAVVGDPSTTGGATGPVGPVVQPSAVSVAGSHNSEMGCPGDWQPDCDQAQLTLDAADGIWKGTYDLPAGDYEYKAAINKSWDENYGAGAVRAGSNIAYSAPGGDLTFYYDHRTHWVTSDAQNPVITAPGSFQSELGCPGDWSPDCMNPWLQDPDGDGVYTWSGSMTAGNYEFKVAHGLAWDENYGADGVPNGANMSLTVPSDGVVLTISYTLSTHRTTTTVSRAGPTPDLTSAKAYWVRPGLLAWPAAGLPEGIPPEVLDWRLSWADHGGLAVDAESLTGGSVSDLTLVPGGLPSGVRRSHPELAGYLALRVKPALVSRVPALLRQQVAVSLHDDLGALVDATGIQTAIVLDDLYAEAASRRTYGPSFPSGAPTYRVWAPTAQRVNLLSWPAGSAADAPVADATRIPMSRQGDGSWTARGGQRNSRYLYEVVVFVPSTGAVETNLVTDPYSTGLTLNSTRSVAVDLGDKAFRPALWSGTAPPPLAQRVDTTVYELHVRDFSIADPTVSAANRGSYLAFAEAGDGTAHLRALAAAGLNTVHLLPTFDIASIEEDPAAQASPDCDLASFAPDSEEQQACVEPARAADGFNWGYDPWHFSVPEGSYASSAAAADGGTRVAEFRTMVGALHRDGVRVVLDQVFNHTAASGQDAKSVFDKIVPGYYHRRNATGAVETSTCCQNLATEHAMAQRLMVDSVVRWARDYRVDGFRFDLMGHHSRANMLAVRAALDALTPARDGVDGSSVYLYGEGWNFGEVADNALFTQATQGQLAGTGIGTFSDRLRDAVRGGGPFDEDPRKQGFGSGELTDDNGADINDGAEAGLKHDTDLVQLGLAGNLRTFRFRLNDSGVVARGDQIDYNGQPAGYATEPDEVITYVDAHDNETLFDSLALKLPASTMMADRVRMNTVSLATTALAQTPSFWHAGADLLRSKSLDRNSYDSGDWFNPLDWTGADNGFGRGLPLEGDNAAKWSYMRPLLADPALKPAASDVQIASAQAQDLLRLRFSTRLFRLGSAEAIRAKVSFPASGTADAHPGVIVMRIDDTQGADLDPALKGLVVVFNATPDAVSQRVAGLTGASLQLSPIQATGSDPVVRAATWAPATATATVPPRTVAVFLQP